MITPETAEILLRAKLVELARYQRSLEVVERGIRRIENDIAELRDFLRITPRLPFGGDLSKPVQGR